MNENKPSDNERVRKCLLLALELLNRERESDEELIAIELNTILFGESGKLDSLGLVSFVTFAEKEIENEFGVSLVLVDEEVLMQRESPFRTVDTLTKHVSDLLKP